MRNKVDFMSWSGKMEGLSARGRCADKAASYNGVGVRGPVQMPWIVRYFPTEKKRPTPEFSHLIRGRSRQRREVWSERAAKTKRPARMRAF
jgi:hypothetical protein